MIESHLPVYIPFTFLAFSLVIPLLAIWKDDWSQPVATAGAGGAALLSLYGVLTHAGSEPLRYYFGGWPPPVGIEFVYDGLSAFMLAVVNIVTFLVLIHSRKIRLAEFASKQMAFYSVVMLMMLGFNGMILTGDLFNMFVFLEIASLSGYALIAIGGKPAPVAAFRYLIIGTVGGSLYLLGVGFLYNVTGTLNMKDVADMLPLIAAERSLVTALILMAVGIGIKSALFPMHGWLPDSYTHASSTSSALIAPIGTKVAAYVLIRILLFTFGLEQINAVVPLTTILGLLACAGILYGSIMAIAQFELKRMLAYSSVAQIGYIILGFSLGSVLGLIGALLHVLNHAVMKACLFMVAANLRLQEGHSDIRRMDDSYRLKYPGTMAAFTLAALSMIGLPPLAGFFSKWYLALAVIEKSNWLFLVVLLVSSLLNAVYFFRILEKVYLKNPKIQETGAPPITPRQEPPASMLWPTLILGVMLLALGLGNVPIVNFLEGAAP